MVFNGMVNDFNISTLNWILDRKKQCINSVIRNKF